MSVSSLPIYFGLECLYRGFGGDDRGPGLNTYSSIPLTIGRENSTLRLGPIGRCHSSARFRNNWNSHISHWRVVTANWVGEMAMVPELTAQLCGAVDRLSLSSPGTGTFRTRSSQELGPTVAKKGLGLVRPQVRQTISLPARHPTLVITASLRDWKIFGPSPNFRVPSPLD